MAIIFSEITKTFITINNEEFTTHASSEQTAFVINLIDSYMSMHGPEAARCHKVSLIKIVRAQLAEIGLRGAKRLVEDLIDQRYQS